MTSDASNTAASCSWDPANILNLKGVFCGSGSDMMNDSRPIGTIVKLVGKPTEFVQVLYLGTATYDIEKFQARQTQRFLDIGCQVSILAIAEKDDDKMKSTIENADVIVVGGGNTLYAVDRWRNMNMIPHLRKAMERGAVLTGGSAGAICWFDGGHSDSMDPDTYREAMLKRFCGTDSISVTDEADTASSDVKKEWNYIRIPALGFVPGLVCPHHDRTQSNGLLRAIDFDRLLLQSPGELGIAIDHWAALVIDGENYHVMSFEEKEGSVKDGESFVSDGSGRPGIWIKEVVGGKVQHRVCPVQGLTKDLLRRPTIEIVNDDDALDQCRADNPQPQE